MRKLALFLKILIVLVILICCFYSCQQKNANNGITIGAIIPLTGSASEFGKYNLETSKMIVEELNKKYQNKFKLLIEDSKSTPKDAINAYKKISLTNKNIVIISSELSSISMSLAPETQKNSQLLIAIAATPKIKNYDYVIRMYPNAGSEASCFTNACNNFLNNKRSLITIYYINDEFGKSVSELTTDSLKKFGFINVVNEPFSANIEAKNLAAKNEKANLNIVVGYGSIMGNIIKEIRNYNKGSIIISSPEVRFSDILNIIPHNDTLHFCIDIDPPSAEINNIYISKFGRAPNLVDLLIFDGFNVTLNEAAILLSNQQKITGEKLYKSILGKNYTFHGRAIKVDSTGNILYYLSINRVFNH